MVKLNNSNYKDKKHNCRGNKSNFHILLGNLIQPNNRNFFKNLKRLDLDKNCCFSWTF